MTKSALIVVDVQNDFVSGSLALKNCPAKENGEEIVEVVNNLTDLPGWNVIAFTLDWHPSDHISFVTNAHKYKQHPDSKVDKEHAEVYDVVSFALDNDVKREQALWPPHCVQGSHGAQLHSGLSIPERSHFVKKGAVTDLDSYSAFFDNDKLNETELQNILRSESIERTFICGLATDICVYYTVKDSLHLGFETYLVEDACRGVDCSKIAQRKAELKELGAVIISSDQVQALLSAGKSTETTS